MPGREKSSLRGVKRVFMDWLKRLFFGVYRLGSRLGVAPVPTHYYAAEPNIFELERTRDLWTKPLSLVGIAVDLDGQLHALAGLCTPYRNEYADSAAYRTAVREGYGPGYGEIEAQALHGVIRASKPRRIIEIGSGVSTACARAALRTNETDGRSGTITCVEPHPSPRLLALAASDASVTVIRDLVQAVPVDLFTTLEANDLLFVDSSHVVKAGSDVTHIVLEILPRLRPGVMVHFHDSYLPYAYQRDVLRTFLHSNESAMVTAFLSFNSRFRILFSLSHLHYERPEGLKAVFPRYRPQPGWRGLQTETTDGHFPSSLYLVVTS
jgi:predicted O-methyltransferase YrrM